MQISARDTSYPKSGPSTASFDTATALSSTWKTQTRHPVLSPEREVVQTYAYMGNVSIIEAPIAPVHFGRV